MSLLSVQLDTGIHYQFFRHFCVFRLLEYVMYMLQILVDPTLGHVREVSLQKAWLCAVPH